ncbi:MAG: hypothetical protein K2Q23_15475, partial [Bryobacteraceae bacterium]|nr:hypothetical protein [Bryobacteraceae bacterium]
MIRSLLREPLLHASLLFAAWVIRNPESAPVEPARPKILITDSRIDSLIDLFAKARQRPPTRDELQAILDDYLQEEVFYREALAMGLDQDDAVVRRR